MNLSRVIALLVLSIVCIGNVYAEPGDNESNIFTIDNRKKDLKISSIFCDPESKTPTYFIAGVDLHQTFTAEFIWPGCEEGIIQWATKDGIVYEDYFTKDDPEAKRTFNVGSFSAGDYLEVTVIGVLGDKDEYMFERPVRANFEVIPEPPALFPNLSFVWSKQKYETDTFGLGLPVLQKEPYAIYDDNTLEGLADCKWFNIIEVAGEIDLKGHSEIKAESDVLSTDIKISKVKIKSNLGLVLTYDYFNGDWERGGGFDVGCFGKVQSPPTYVVFLVGPVPVPTYYMFGVQTGFEASCRFTDGSAGNPIFVGEIPVKASVEGTAGVGFSGFASVEGYLKGGMNLNFDVYPEAYLKDWYLELNGGVRIKLILYSYENNFLHYRWPGAAAANMQMMAAEALTVENMTPMGRGYLGSGYAVWSDSTSPKTRGMLLLGLADSETTLQSNIFGQSEAKLTVSNGVKCLVWLYDEPTRNSLDRTMLVYSINDGSGWSVPKAIDDDGTADAMPSLTVDSSGNFVCAWSNASELIPDGTDIGGFADKLDVSLAAYNSGTDTWTSETVTNSAALDYNPKVVCDAGNTTVVWIHDNNNDILAANSPVINHVMARTKTISGWQAEQILATTDGLVKYIDAEIDSSGSHIVYCLDTDSNFGTDTDNELFYLVNSAGVWSSPAQLTNDPNSDVNPQFVKTSTALMLLWAKDGKIVSTTDIAGMTNIVEAVAQEGSSGQRSFVATASPSGNISVIWNDPSETGSDMYTATYDPAMDAWSDIVRITDSQDMERSITAAYSADDRLELAYNKVHFDKAAVGLDAFGQVDLCTNQYQIGADITVSADGITVDDPNAVPGDTVTLTANISNIGDIAVSDIPVTFYCGQTADLANQIGTTQLISGSLLAGQTSTVSVEWVIPQNNEIQNVIVVVDPELQIEDKNRQNNSASLGLFGPNISIDNIIVTEDIINDHVVSVTIVNNGFAPVADEFTVQIQDYDRSITFDSKTISTLDVEQTETVELTVPADQIKYGFIQLRLAVDTGNVVSEISVSDNYEYILVKNYGKKDLVVDGVINMLDLELLAQQWLGSSNGSIADISPNGGDGFVDIIDFSDVSNSWMEQIATALPNVIGLDRALAETTLVDAGFTVGAVTEQFSDAVDIGKVISQSPLAGALYLDGSLVDMIISLGQPITVPDLASMTQSEAETAIVGAGLSVGTITQQYSSTVALDLVVSQYPAAGELIPQTGSIDIVISLGPPSGDDFESGDFSVNPWQNSGDADWVIVSDAVHDGTFSAKSGVITHNQQSSIEVTLDTSADTISFYMKVSSESGYDYLKFYIDDTLQNSWSGTIEWTEQEYTITQGEHTFKWSYTKDGSVSSGSDCTWIDDVMLYNQ